MQKGNFCPVKQLKLRTFLKVGQPGTAWGEGCFSTSSLLHERDIYVYHLIEDVLQSAAAAAKQMHNNGPSVWSSLNCGQVNSGIFSFESKLLICPLCDYQDDDGQDLHYSVVNTVLVCSYHFISGQFLLL